VLKTTEERAMSDTEIRLRVIVKLSNMTSRYNLVVQEFHGNTRYSFFSND